MSHARHPTTVHAAIAVIKRRGRYLIAQRRSRDYLGGYWEFPGGKREAGESWEACVRRELQEELGVAVSRVMPYGNTRYRYEDRIVLFRIFRCVIASGRPCPLEAQALRWVTPGGLRRYRFPPANARLVARLSGLLSTASRRGIIDH